MFVVRLKTVRTLLIVFYVLVLSKENSGIVFLCKSSLPCDKVFIENLFAIGITSASAVKIAYEAEKSCIFQRGLSYIPVSVPAVVLRSWSYYTYHIFK